MKIINVSPIVKIPLPNPQILSYFSSENIVAGSLILIELRNKKTPAIVLTIENIEKIKGNIKKLSYKIKPISKIIKKEPVILESRLRLIQKLSEYYYEPLGLFLKLAIPQKLYTTKKELIFDEKIFLEDNSQNLISKNPPKPTLIHSHNYNAIEKIYFKKIKESIKNKKNVLILFPENSKAEIFSKALNSKQKEFENFKILNLTGEQSPKKKFELWIDISTAKTPIIAVGARNAIFAPIKNLGLIIIDEEDSPFYKSWDSHPRLNSKKAALMLANITNSELILSSRMPSVESHWLATTGVFNHQKIESETKFSEKSIINMTEEIKQGNYSSISYNLKSEIFETLKNKEQIILFINRRGNANMLLCKDCGFIFKCPNCDVSLIHHSGKNKNFLVCHHCGHTEASIDFCPKCNSHKLNIWGGGTQKIEKEIELTFPKAKIALIDSDAIKNQNELNLILEKFNRKKIDILIGTQMVFKEKNINSAKTVSAINIDHSLNFPDFNSGETTFRIIKKLESLVKNGEKLILQTFNPNSKILSFAISDEMEDFYIHELETRKDFDYPPFVQIIKAKFKHKNPIIAKRESEIIAKKLDYFLQTVLKEKGSQIIGPAPAFIPRIKNQYIWQIIIKIPKIKNHSEVDLESRNRLLELIPSNWEVDVDPLGLL